MLSASSISTWMHIRAGFRPPIQVFMFKKIKAGLIAWLCSRLDQGRLREWMIVLPNSLLQLLGSPSLSGVVSCW